MTTLRFGGRSFHSSALLASLAVLVVAVALLTPEPAGSSQGGRSSLSTGPDGVRMMFELAERMGWRAERRMAPLDSTIDAPSVQVVLAPDGTLGAREVHRLLSNVRRGGGLIFALDAEEIADSLRIFAGRPGRFLADYSESACGPATVRSLREDGLIAIPPEVRQIVWRRPAPGPTEVLASTRGRADGGLAVGVGFPMGAGRVAVVSTSEIFANDAVRQCRWGADIALARVLEYVRPVGGERPRLVFDEYHHGFGMHGGSLSAIARYLSRTRSGHFVAQALLAGLVLLLAMAPRPIVPREPERIVRRSPLEHAEALGYAYADVGASRTATVLLVSGLRRRVGRAIPGSARLDEDAFLDAVAARVPQTTGSIGAIRRALRQSDAASTRLSPLEIDAIGDAVRDIERQLTTTLSHHS